MNKDYQVLIVGCGPCGIGAAVELHKMGIKVAIIERSSPGGKVNIAPRVDNYPGYKQIAGPDLAYVFFQRIQESGVPIIGDEVLSLSKGPEGFLLKCQNEEYLAPSILLATGTKEKKLGLENEDRLLGHGLSYCALCDGHFYKGVDIAVIGGGNAALKEAIYLSHIVHKLYLVHRRSEFRGNQPFVDELRQKPNVEIITPYVPLQILDDGKVTGLKIQNCDTNEIKTLQIQGLFPLVGQIPNSQFVHIEGVLDEYGNIPVDKQMMTSVPGLFAGGDVLPRPIRQIYLAEHDGKLAASSIQAYLKGAKL